MTIKNKEQKNNIAIIAPGKGWGNFVSFIGTIKKISEVKNKKIILITKKASSANAYLNNESFIKKIFEIPNDSRGFYKKIKLIFDLSFELFKENVKEAYIFHSSFIFVIICFIARVKNIYAPGIRSQIFFLKKNNRIYNCYHEKELLPPVAEVKQLVKKVLKIQDFEYTPLQKKKYGTKKGRIAICIACSGWQKQWGVKNYIELIKIFKDKGYIEFLILSGKDQENLENIIQSSFLTNREFIFTAKKKINEIVDDLSMCEFFIGHDTGFSHLSRLLGIKTFVIGADTEPEIYTNLCVFIDIKKNIVRSDQSTKTIKIDDVIKVLNEHGI